MNKKHFLFLISASFILLNPVILYAQAYNWLSQPDVEVPQILNGETDLATISANGRFVAFTSTASNIVAGDDNQVFDLFIYDTVNASVTRHEIPTPTSSFLREISPPTSDGRYVMINFSATSIPNYLYLLDIQNDSLSLENLDGTGNRFHLDSSSNTYLSDDATQIIFSSAENLSPLHTTGIIQVYQKDLNTDVFTLLSVSADGTTAADEHARVEGVSVNGRFVGFDTFASNILPDLTLNSRGSLVLLDLNDLSYQLASVKPDGTPSSVSASFGFRSVSVSNSGQIAYISRFPDLVDGDTNDSFDVFYFDGTSNTRINLDSNGQELPVGGSLSDTVYISPNDNFISYSNSSDQIISNDSNSEFDTFIYNLNDGSTTRASSTATGQAANDRSFPMGISANGQTLLMLSAASDLGVGNNSTNLYNHLYTYDMASSNITGTLPSPALVVNTASAPVTDSQISADQKYAFYLSNSPYLSADPISQQNFSGASSIKDLFLFDKETGTHSIIARKVRSDYDVSPSGRFVVFRSGFFQPAAQAEIGMIELFIYDRENASYTQLLNGSGPQVNDAGMVVFNTNLALTNVDNNGSTDVYLYEPTDNSFSLVSKTLTGVAPLFTADNAFISGSADDVWVGFTTFSSDIINNDINNRIDVFMYSWPDGNVFRVNQRPDGTGDNDGLGGDRPAISDDGAYVLFTSLGTNLTSDDFSDADRVQLYVYERATQDITLVSLNTETGDPFEDGMRVDSYDISNSGRFIAYSVSGIQQSLNDFNPGEDVFLYDQDTQTVQLISTELDGSSVFQAAPNSVNPQVVEDLNVTPPLVGVIFDAAGRLTNIDNHPGHSEAFLYQQDGPNVELNIQISGTGTVNGSFGISCMTECDSNYPLGTQLNLIATPDTGFIFDGWIDQQGQCSDEVNTCQLTMDRDKTLQAIFLDSNDIIFSNGFE